MIEKITMPISTLIVLLMLAAIFGANYIAIIINAIVSAIMGFLRSLWFLIVFFAVICAICFVLSNISFS